MMKTIALYALAALLVVCIALSVVYVLRLSSSIAVPVTRHETDDAVCYIASKESGVAISCLKKEKSE